MGAGVATAPPKPAATRIVELDALRGLAVAGIALMNVLVYALPAQAYWNPWAWRGDAPGTLESWAVAFVLVDGKFRTLFAMLFGAGVAILLTRPGEGVLRGHYARMAVLFAIGMVHAILLANNDILRAYALAGLLLPLFARRSVRALWVCAALALAAHLIGALIWIGPAWSSWWSGQPATAADQWPFAWRFGALPEAIAATLERGNESFGERIDRRLDRLGPVLANLVNSVPVNLAAMLAGMALWHNGLLKGQWPAARLRRMVVIFAGVALPLLIALAALQGKSGFAGIVVGAVATIGAPVPNLLLGIAYAAAAMALFAVFRQSAAVRVLAAAGRLSLTNYLTTSLIFAMLFADWGLDLFGTVTRAEAIAMAAIPIVAMMVWSPLWLARFGQGPAERLWRAAAARLAGQAR